MTKKIKVTMRSIVTYEPRLDDDPYKGHGITTLEEALALDLSDLNNGVIDFFYLSKDRPEVRYEGEIVNDDDS
jgi:hypothetical protein